MLSRSSQQPSISSSDTVHPLEDYLSDLEPQASEFPKLDNANSEDDSNNESVEYKKDERRSDTDQKGFAILLNQNSFEEMLGTFLVTSHKKLFVLQSKIYHEQNLTDRSIPSPNHKSIPKTEALRDYIYQLQMLFFETRKGKKFDTST